MDNKEFYFQALDLIKHHKKDTKSADIINILDVLKQITTQNYVLMDILLSMAKALQIDGQLLATTF